MFNGTFLPISIAFPLTARLITFLGMQAILPPQRVKFNLVPYPKHPWPIGTVSMVNLHFPPLTAFLPATKPLRLLSKLVEWHTNTLLA